MVTLFFLHSSLAPMSCGRMTNALRLANEAVSQHLSLSLFHMYVLAATLPDRDRVRLNIGAREETREGDSAGCAG